MLKGFAIAILLVLGASQLDQHYCQGRYTDGALAMLRHMRHSFGI